MKLTGFLIISALASFPALAGKQALLNQKKLENLFKGQESSFSKALNRENKYSVEGLTLQQKIQSEFQAVTSNIQKQVIAAYKAELLLNDNDSNAAKESVLKFITKDLEVVDQKLADDIQTLSAEVLKNVDANHTDSELMTEAVELSVLKSNITAEVLENEMILETVSCCENFTPQTSTSKDAHKKNYANIPELIESLVSDRESAKYVSSSNQQLITAQATTKETKMAMSVKIPFLGVTGDIGTSVTFKKETLTSATIMAEGLHPVLYVDGNFDHYKRNRDGSILKINGVDKKRFVTFTCDADMEFTNESTMGGGLSIAAPGISASGEKNWSKTYKNSVNMSSRRIVLPEYINNQTVTVKLLSQICHQHFLKAKFNDRLTVEKSLELMMRNVVSGLEFSHAKTKCSKDEHCYDWFNTKIIGIAKLQNFPRCTPEAQGYLNCKLKGLKGQNCPVIEKGKRISNGEFEFSCDKGLKCVKNTNIVYASGSVESYFFGKVKTWAKGTCQPANAKTYKSPMKAHQENGNKYIEVQFQ